MSILALTPGEPAGIGPDLCLQLAAVGSPYPLAAIADPDMLAERARLLGLDINITEWHSGNPVSTEAGHLAVLPVKTTNKVKAGQLDEANAAYVLETIRQAAEGCLAGQFHGLVTGPIHKGIINQAGIPFTGHTEYLQELCDAGQVVMMLTAGDLRVALATTHLPLKDICSAITETGLERTLQILHGELQTRFGLSQPRILVCGLNPHAGEDGHLGREEIEIIEPVLERCRQQGMQLAGPLPADTAFVPSQLEEADAVLAMYHDQGLPVLKHHGFGRAINVTLGLPIIRTSVDHGTALELAGTGKAHSGSLEAAIELAAGMQS